MHKVLVTLGPTSLDKYIISEFDALGVDLYRINLSHTSLDDVEKNIRFIRSFSDTEICLDSEGAQLRNVKMRGEKTTFSVGEKVTIHFDEIIGDSNNISFNPKGIARQFIIGDEIKIDFNNVKLRITSIKSNHCVALVVNSGTVGSNKAADVNRELKFDALTAKDKEAIKIGLSLQVNNFALSFTNSGDDVELIRSLCGRESNIISKIESKSGLINLDDILQVADQILIDRGDLSRQIPIKKVPFLQRKIISRAQGLGKQVFVATNLLESMVMDRTPTRAEVNDVVSTLEMGASGLVLAAETAIGKFPVEAVKMIRDLIEEHLRWDESSTFEQIINH